MTDILIGFAALTVGAFIFGLIVIAMQKIPEWIEAACMLVIVVSVLIFGCYVAGQGVRELYNNWPPKAVGAK